MTTYVITAPDGKEYEVDAPQGASQDDALRYFQTNWKPATTAPEVAPTDRKQMFEQTAEEMPWYQQMAAGAGGAVKGLGLGIKQLAGQASEEEVRDYQQAMSGLRGTGGGIVGEIFANMLPGAAAFRGASAIPAVARGIAAGGRTAGATIAGLGGATGAVEGVLAPVTSEQSRGFNAAIGGGVGAVAPALIGGVTRGAQVVKDAVAPMVSQRARQLAGGRMLRDVAGNRADDVVTALQRSQPIVSGQTAGQATADVAVPEFAALQKVVSDLAPDTPMAKELARRGARVDEIRSFAKTELDLQDAINKRGAEASANYARAFQNTVKWDVDLGQIFKNPYIRDTLPTVRKLVQARTSAGEKVPLAEQLQMIKKELDATIAGTPMNKPSDNTAKEVMAVQGKLTDWMTNKLPDYRKAITDYAESSKPINEMKIGQTAINVLQKQIGDKETPEAFAKAVADEMKLLKSTGFTRSELDKQLSPQNMDILNRVRNELDIDARFKEQATAGMRGERLRSAVGDVVELPNMLNNAVTLTNSVLRRVTKGAKIKTLKELAEVMQDPQLTAKMMQDASVKEQNAIKFLINAQRAGAIVTTGVNRSYQ